MDIEKFIENAIKDIREKTKGERILVSCSGGVDSTITAILVGKATKNFSCYFIDSGLMRSHDYSDAQKNLGKFDIDVEYADYSNFFFGALKGKKGPEEKRIAVRETFYKKALPGIAKKEKTKYVAQGTIKADIDETKAGIKTQHNVIEQIGISYGFSLIEPLTSIYKNDVRETASFLGLHELAERMPFPGPGLATRIEGEVTREKVKLIRKAHEIVEEETENALKKGKLSERPFQIFPALLGSMATGTKEGKRTFEHLILLRAVKSKDALTAEVYELPYSFLEKITSKLTKELNVRICYDITPKPPATIEII